MKLIWDADSKRIYEAGVHQGVLYPRDDDGGYPSGVAWNGLTTVTESPSGAEATPSYADNMKYINMVSAEEFGATVEAYTYPDEFIVCDGTGELTAGVYIGQQTRKTFGLCYRTLIGNDVSNIDYGYKLHLVYGCLASPSEKAYGTINDSPEAITFSWEVTTTPVLVTGFKPTASLTVDSTKVDSDCLAALENILYGTAEEDARLPLPDEVYALFASAAPSAVALSSIVPDDDSNTAALDANIVLTFNNKILREAIVVTKADGTIVPGSKVWDAAGKILTFNPTDNLTPSAVYIVAVTGVVDIYNQALAASVKNFTVAAG